MEANQTPNPVSRWGQWSACVGLATLLLWDHIRLLTSAENRYSMHWDSADPWLILALLLAIGTAIFAGGRIVDRLGWKWLVASKNATFVLAAGIGIAAFLNKGLMTPTPAWQTICIILMSVFGLMAVLSFFSQFQNIHKGFRKACTGFSIAGLYLVIQIFTWPTYDMNHNPGSQVQLHPQALTGSTNQPDVFMILFDAWSWERSLGETDPIDKQAEWPNLMSLVQESTVYEQAYSPFIPTIQSIPQIFFQTTCHFVLENSGQCRFYDPVTRDFSTISDRPNLFSWMKESGYKTHFAGWGYPWNHFVGDDLDDGFFVNSTPVTKYEAGLTGRTGWHLGYGLIRFLKSIPAPLAFRWRVGLPLLDYNNWHFASMNESIHKQSLKIASESAQPTFAVIFYGTPHPPFACDRDGLRSDVLLLNGDAPGYQSSNESNTIEGYRANMRYADKLLGDLIQTLKANGRYEDSLIIVTSDHCFAGDPRIHKDFGDDAKAYYDSRTHVPLIIKAPKQNKPLRHKQRFELVKLHSLIEKQAKMPPMFGH